MSTTCVEPTPEPQILSTQLWSARASMVRAWEHAAASPRAINARICLSCKRGRCVMSGDLHRTYLGNENVDLAVKNGQSLVLAVHLHPYCCTDIALELMSQLVIRRGNLIEKSEDG